MYIKLFNSNKEILLSNNVFNVKFNNSLVHQVIVSCQNNKRKGNSCQKSKSEVSGSNKKPWRQKGTGRARSGSIRSPIWRSGGVCFASKPKKYNIKVNKKVYKLAFKMILSKLFKNYNKNIYILDNIFINKPKTKYFLNYFNFIKMYKCLLILDKLDNNLLLSSRNLYNFKVCDVFHINIVDLVIYKSIILNLNSIKIIEKRLLNENIKF